MPIYLIFLDIDGVLNSDKWMRSFTQKEWDERIDKFSITHHLDPKAVDRLNRIVDGHRDLRVVISSSWRVTRSLDHIKDGLTARGFKHADKIIGKTGSNGWNLTEACGVKAQDHRRGMEIAEWLDEQSPSVDGFVVLDDAYDCHTLGDHWVRTSLKVGLIDSDIARVAAALALGNDRTAWLDLSIEAQTLETA